MSIAKHSDKTACIPLEETGAIRAGTSSNGWKAIFSVMPISQGTIVFPGWHETFYKGMPGWKRFSVREIEALPESTRALVIQYGLDEDFDCIVGPIDRDAVITLDNFINHCCDPNLGYDLAGNVIAARDIQPGEELTIDYGCFTVNLDEKWECRCGANGCRRFVRRTDWMALARQRGFAMPRFLYPKIAEMGLPRSDKQSGDME